MYSDRGLLEAIQRERNPTMAELEREHAIDVVRNATTNYQRMRETERESFVRVLLEPAPRRFR